MPIKKICVAVLLATALTASLAGCGIRPLDPTVSTDDKPTSSQIVRIPEEQAKVRTVEATETGVLEITDADLENIIDAYRLPDLERMDAADAKELVDPLQSIQRTLDLHEGDMSAVLYPEYNYKAAYNKTYGALDGLWSDLSESTYTGDSASGLNTFMEQNGGYVRVASATITADEPISIPNGCALDGNGCRITAAGGNDRAFDLTEADSVSLSNFVIEDGFDYGIFVDKTNRFKIEGCDITGAARRALCILNECSTFEVIDCYVHENDHGGIFISGDVSYGIFEGNVIEANEGYANSDAGFFLGQFNLVKPGTADTSFWEPDQTELVHSPHQLVVIDNEMRGNRAQGFYSHAGWDNYFISNTIENNHKEGACMDFGTTTTYVAYNQFVNNGWRVNVDDGEPEFNKLPGISMDNACYNIIRANIFAENGGTGIKAVRASVRNIIIDNSVIDNNGGASENGHFFGIELASDLKPDHDGAAGLDFAPCMENIVARNTISGAHYAGVYLGVDDYANDVFNNIIMGATEFSIECHSTKFNSIVDNIVDTREFYDGVIIG